MASPLSILKTVINLKHIHVESLECLKVPVTKFGQVAEQEHIIVHARPFKRKQCLCPICKQKCVCNGRKYQAASHWRAPNLNGVPVFIAYCPQRIYCLEHGALNEYIPWSDGTSRFTEDFNNVAELCAAILARGVSSQIKRGLGKEYMPRSEALSTLRGRIDIPETLKTQALQRRQMVCSYDDFSVNSYMNQVVKSTMLLLLKADIAKGRKKELRRLLVFFGDVCAVDLHLVNWRFHYNRNNQTYRMLIAICYLVVKGLLQTQADGTARLMDFVDEQRMCRLYEKFVLEYYRREHPQIAANASQIPWQLDDGMNDMLPVMQSDIMLSHGEKTLIIDAKYYARSTQTRYDKTTLHSGNIYQIFTYVKNKEAELAGQPHEVSGMLLYAKTDEDTFPGHEYRMSGNKIEVRVLNLDCDFEIIKSQLDEIVEKYLME